MAEAAPLPLPPGSAVGILGGGQLGRMLAIAAARLGLEAHIYDPDPAPPAAAVATRHVQGAYDDAAALARFAAGVQVATFEFESVPAATAAAVAAHTALRPNARAFAIAQDRALEKAFLEETGLAPAPWVAIEAEAEIAPALARLGGAAILKTRRLGYDGKGQARIAGAEEAGTAWAAIGAVPAVLERVVPFTAELSVIAARGVDGAVAAYDPGRNEHADGILRRTTIPAGLPASVLQDAVLAAGRILRALDYVGVIGVEFFFAPGASGGPLFVNEIAPRVHNTGHWTIEACAVDQFEQHIRAVAGWPLGDGARHADAVMTNLIGDEAAAWAELAAEPGAALHLYGKAEIRPGRKMGHVTHVTPRRAG
ncbi:MAG: 5-(carboxyamino)imidazole ribonucleotide synthase [Pseudomonadota bacterium]